MTPEAALRVGAAFASRFALPAKAAVCASGEPISVVLKIPDAPNPPYALA